MEQKIDTVDNVQLPKKTTDSISVDIGLLEYLLSLNQQTTNSKYDDLQGKSGVWREIKTIARRFGFIYLKENGPVFGIYLRDLQREETLASASDEIRSGFSGKGYEVRIGYTF